MRAVLAALLAEALASVVAAPSAPVIENTGHDFALLAWEPDNATAEPVAYRVFSSQWGLSYLKYNSPDLTGVYMNDGVRLEVCTRPDGILGEWRFVAYLSATLGGYNAYATGRWSVPDGGYLGGMIYSNTSGVSGARLAFSHRDGYLRLLGSAYDLLTPTWKGPPEVSTEDFPRLGDGDSACRLMPPQQQAAQLEAPDITGRYFSYFNESFAVCTANGTLFAAYSGLHGLQGLVRATWNAVSGRWEGLVLDADGGAANDGKAFSWEADNAGGLKGNWEVYNRTWQWPPGPEGEVWPLWRWEAGVEPPANHTVVPPWRAWPAGDEAEPEALAGGKLSLQHVCGLLEVAVGGEQAMGPVGHDEDAPSPLFAAPRFPLHNCSNTTSNATYACGDPADTHDVGGFFRRAPVERIFAWGADVVEVNQTGSAAPRAVLSGLRLGAQYRFRVAAHFEHAPYALPPADCDAGIGCGRCLLLLPPAACPAQPDLPQRCDGAPAGALCEADGECATDQSADNCGGFDVYSVLYALHAAPYALGAPSAYSVSLTVRPSGPGPPVELSFRAVDTTSIRLEWAPPLVDPSGGVWHGEGGAPMLGYRVMLRVASRADAAGAVAEEEGGRLVGSTVATELLVTGLPPQTLFELHVVGENTVSRGLASAALTVATRALRATLYTQCAHGTEVHTPLKYQGCFRDAPGAPVMAAPAEGDAFSHALSAETCAARCEGYEYFGLRAGGVCRCGGAEGYDRYGAVPDTDCDARCTGDAARACGGAAHISVYRQAGRRGVLLGVGNYTSFDLMRLRLPPRSLAAVALPDGLALTLHQHDGFGGRALDLTAASNASVLRCLAAAPCATPASTHAWAEPPQGCAGGTWGGAAASLQLRYVGLPELPYTPRPNQETGARAFELSTQGALARLFDLGGDMAEDAAARVSAEGTPATALAAAPRRGDSAECASATGGYTADRVCVEAAGIAFLPPEQVPHQNSYFAFRRANPSHIHTDEFERLAREEWRATLREFASPFYDELQLAGKLHAGAPPAAGAAAAREVVPYEAWFAQWLASILHMLPLLSAPDAATPPLLGFDDEGGVVAYEHATAPPLPAHPLPSAEAAEHMLTLEEAASSGLATVVAAAAEAEALRAAAAAAAEAEAGPPEEEVYELLQEEYDQGAAAAEVKAALHTYALAAGDPNRTKEMVAQLESRSPDSSEALFGPFR